MEGLKIFLLEVFEQERFLPDVQRSVFPNLASLFDRLDYPYNLGFEIVKGDMEVFEGSNGSVGLAYFGINAKKESDIMERSFLDVGGRRVYLELNWNGKGNIRFEDRLGWEAGDKIGGDSSGGSYNMWHPVGEFCFMRRVDKPNLPGVRAFMEYLIGKQ